MTVNGPLREAFAGVAVAWHLGSGSLVTERAVGGAGDVDTWSVKEASSEESAQLCVWNCQSGHGGNAREPVSGGGYIQLQAGATIQVMEHRGVAVRTLDKVAIVDFLQASLHCCACWHDVGQADAFQQGGECWLCQAFVTGFVPPMLHSCQCRT